MQHEYQRIATRNLQAARIILDAGIHEIAAFNGYHAYESTASALAAAFNNRHGGNVRHREKLNIFLQCVATTNNRRIISQIQRINGRFESLRNRLLYPHQPRYSQSISLPENVITPQQVERLLQDVQEIVDWVGEQI